MSEESSKYAQFIPPEIEFKGDITKMEVLTKVILGYTFAGLPFFFMDYYVMILDKSIAFFDKNTYTQVFKVDFTDEEGISTLKKIDDDTLLVNMINLQRS